MEARSLKPTPHLRRPRTLRKRSEIVRAGLKVFASKGFHAATMEDIALELEATKGMLYYYFKTKEEILSAILTDNELLDALESGFTAIRSMSMRDALHTMLHGALKLMEQNQELIRFLQVQAFLSKSQADLVYTQLLERFHQIATQLVEHFQQTGELKPQVKAGYLSQMLLDLVTSHFMKKQIFGAHLYRSAEYLDEALTVMLSGIETAKPQPA